MGDGREWGLLILIGDCKSCDKLLEYVYKVRFSSRNNAAICKCFHKSTKTYICHPSRSRKIRSILHLNLSFYLSWHDNIKTQ
jgi:hypothetical protein